jgi:hypothetical protein
VPLVPVGPATGEWLNVHDSDTQRVSIKFDDDLSARDVRAFDAPREVLVKPDGRAGELRQMESALCRLGDAVPQCAGNLSQCLAVNISDMDAVCGCYSNHTACWAAAGCLDKLPADDADFCANTLLCSRAACTGSGAASSRVGLVFALVAAALVLGAALALA